MANVTQIIGVLVVCIAMVVGIAYWLDSRPDQRELTLDETQRLAGPLSPKELAASAAAITNTMNPIATISTSMGDIRLELFADQMPITVGNFVTLAEDGFYDGTKFHRVINGFMIQGGDPNSKSENELTYGTGGPGYTIQDEFVDGDLLTNTRGTIAMANTGQPNSGGSQFFINLTDNTPLDFDKQPLSSKHPVFGRVIEGLEVVDQIAVVDTDQRDIPVTPVVVNSVSISYEEAAVPAPAPTAAPAPDPEPSIETPESEPDTESVADDTTATSSQ